ncbi:MAG: PilZ domain-containing protein [Nitrospirota bacterium]|jgi:c-di-GMP-binding flagellar brake protein YcgR
MVEKRRHKRVPLSAIARLVEAGEGEPLPLQGMVADISLGGVGLYLASPLEAGAEIALEIVFPASGGDVRAETVKGTVIYSKRIQHVHFVGIEFARELSPDRQPALHGRVQNILNSD